MKKVTGLTQQQLAAMVSSKEASTVSGTIMPPVVAKLSDIVSALEPVFGEEVYVGDGSLDSEMIRANGVVVVAGKQTQMVCAVWRTGRWTVNKPRSLLLERCPDLLAALEGMSFKAQ